MAGVQGSTDSRARLGPRISLIPKRCSFYRWVFRAAVGGWGTGPRHTAEAFDHRVVSTIGLFGLEKGHGQPLSRRVSSPIHSTQI